MVDQRRGWAGGAFRLGRLGSVRPFPGGAMGRANGPTAKLRGQGPRAEAAAARGMPACESRDAGRVTPFRS